MRPEYVWSMFIFIPQVIFQVIIVAFGEKIPKMVRTAACYGGLITCLLIIPLVAEYVGEFEDNYASYWINTITILFLGMFNSILQGTLFGIAGTFPWRYTSALMFGNGVGGLGINIIRMITMAATDNEFVSLIIFVCINYAILFLCLCSFFVKTYSF
jgi:solute carrier family 29 (equilibrative nucleoside transporter), member 1/2/3